MQWHFKFGQPSVSLTVVRVQGAPINMGIERRLEYRLWFPLIDKWHTVHQKNWKSKELSKVVSLKLT